MEHNGRHSSKPDRVARPWEAGSSRRAGSDGVGYTNLRDLAEEAVDLLLRRKWWVIGTAVIVFHLVLLYTAIQDPLYSASSLVLVEEQRNAQNAELQIGPRDLFARSGRSLQNELIILRSSRSLRRAVGSRLMQQDTVPQTGEPISLLTNDDGEEYSLREVTILLDRMVQFTPAENESDVIRITAYSNSAPEAAFIANTYLEEYLALTRQSSRSQLSASRDYLESQAEEREEELRSIEEKIKRYKRSEGAVALNQEAQNLVERIATVEASRDEAQVELKTRKASLASLEEELRSIRPEQLSRRVASGVEKELEATQARIAELELSKKQVLLRGNSDALSQADSAQVAQIDRRIQELRREAKRLSDSYVEEVLAAGSIGAGESVERVKELRRQIAEERAQITGLEARIEVQTERLQEYEAELSSIPEQAMQLAQLERNRTYAEERYQAVVEQLQETRLQEETELGYADTVTEAAVPLEPIQPRTVRNLILGAFFGVLFGLGLAVGRDRLDSRLYSPETLREASGHRLLGTVPNIQPLIRDRMRGVSTVSVGGNQLAATLVAEVRSKAAAAEAYRHIRTNIQFSASETLTKTLLVTSPGQGDGKSVTASNLAIVMAQAGRRTLLIDADLRRPSIHRLFDLERTPGLSETLTADAVKTPDKAVSDEAVSDEAVSDEAAPDGAASVEAMPDPNVRDTPVENLHVLTAGSEVDRPAERLGSAQLRTLLRALEDQYDFIVVDTPPVLAATDATYLSTQCDGTVVVSRAGETTRPELKHTLESLEDVGARIAGMVFNGFDVSMAYGYKLRYRNYSQYGPYNDYHGPDAPTRQEAPARASTARRAFDAFSQAAGSGWASARDAYQATAGAVHLAGRRTYRSIKSFGQLARERWPTAQETMHALREVRSSAGRVARTTGQFTRRVAKSMARAAESGGQAVKSAAQMTKPALSRANQLLGSCRQVAQGWCSRLVRSIRSCLL